ncbi:ferric-dicitrate binding protein FerR (iron transport regulator) [Flavobacterium sp. HSC-32F16]|uniref:FecR family protein n=1 Tax=Flavobacterium sp. HSC-32F16 TaxID=2910964 RepID=UPI0020A5815F|nr:FecR domain-containing protein [Flavobacterium sp. HSC-32F16]MCP2029682.1 ferric-dicitrate binding protein FerR (iron transport regulator) [Flavobacterium sp. HSC-32F16]
MYPNFKILPEKDKTNLKARIAESIALEKQQARRKRLRTISWSAAAVLCIGLGVMVVLKQEQKVVSPIEKFAKSNEKETFFEKSGQVQLVLSNQEAVNVSDSTTIAYNASGNKINVNSKQIEQKKTLETQYNTVLVPYGKRAQLSLADGTQVWLNSGSKLIYPTAFSSTSREVYLEGEGIFDVAHNEAKPFYVKAANHYSVRVLGTLFNVSCYTKDAKVSTALLRGKVQVSYAKKGLFSADTLQTILKPGMIAALDKKRETIKTTTQNVESLFSWRKGYYEFSQEKLPLVLDKLTRYYNVDFVMNKKASPTETYSGAFKLNDDLEKVVKTLEATTGLEFVYDAETRKITIN